MSIIQKLTAFKILIHLFSEILYFQTLQIFLKSFNTT